MCERGEWVYAASPNRSSMIILPICTPERYALMPSGFHQLLWKSHPCISQIAFSSAAAIAAYTAALELRR